MGHAWAPHLNDAPFSRCCGRLATTCPITVSRPVSGVILIEFEISNQIPCAGLSPPLAFTAGPFRIQHRKTATGSPQRRRPGPAARGRPSVRQLRHHFGPFSAHFSAPTHPTRAVGRVLLGAQAYLVLIGACNPVLCPIWGFRYAWAGKLDVLGEARQLRHHYDSSLPATSTSFRTISEGCLGFLPPHTRAVDSALLGCHAYRMLIGACDPIL